MIMLFVSTKIRMVNRVALAIGMSGIFILTYSEYERGKEQGSALLWSVIEKAYLW